MLDRFKDHRVASIGALCAAVITVALPASAAASFDPEFSVLSRDVRSHETDNGFVGHTHIFNPANLNQKVGKGKVRCRFNEGDRKAHCRVLVHLDGTIGGFGDLVLRGNIGRGDTTLNVVDGTGDFSGAVTGRALVHDVAEPDNLIDFHLTR